MNFETILHFKKFLEEHKLTENVLDFFSPIQDLGFLISSYISAYMSRISAEISQAKDDHALSLRRRLFVSEKTSLAQSAFSHKSYPLDLRSQEPLNKPALVILSPQSFPCIRTCRLQKSLLLRFLFSAFMHASKV